MVQRGRRPVGVGFFFAMGHSSVVVVLAVVVAAAAGAAAGPDLDAWRHFGGAGSTVVAMSFLALVAVLNALVLRGIVGCWRGLRRGRPHEAPLQPAPLHPGPGNPRPRG